MKLCSSHLWFNEIIYNISIPENVAKIFFFFHLCCCRIQKNMLMDLSKDIMMDLGITVVGDIIAILKHAKVVHRQVGSHCGFVGMLTTGSTEIHFHCTVPACLDKPLVHIGHVSVGKTWNICRYHLNDVNHCWSINGHLLPM